MESYASTECATSRITARYQCRSESVCVAASVSLGRWPLADQSYTFNSSLCVYVDSERGVGGCLQSNDPLPASAKSLRACVLFGECARRHDRHHQVVAYSSDLTDSQWQLLEPLLLVPCKRGPKHGDDLRHVVEAML